MKWHIAVALLNGAAGIAAAQDPDFTWLQGSWCGQQGALQIEEHWQVAGNLALGMGRGLRDGQVRSFEFMRIERAVGGVRFLAQPGGAAATAFALVESDERSARFENPQHDFPQSIRYWRSGELLHAEISAADDAGGSRRMRFEYRRCTAP